MVAMLAGIRQLVMLTADAALGAEAQTGRILWRVPIKTAARRHAVTPVITGDHVIVCSFSAGMICLRISQEGDGCKAQQAWANKDLRVNLSTPVVLGDSLFAQGPMKQYVCADVRTGKQTWSQAGFATTYAATIGLGKALLVLTDFGELRLFAADNRKYTELGRAQVCGETWTHPAYADGKLYVREGLTGNWRLSCLELVP
jgi:outer membrane protein assembly factor BamB